MKKPALLTMLMIASSLLPTGLALAEDGRDFAGFFSFTEPAGWSEEVIGTLTLEIFNYSGADVTFATVRMGQFLPAEPLYESLTPVDIAYRDRVVLTESVVTVPRQVYEQWLQGALPMVHIEFTDGGGNQRSTAVELLPLLVEGE